MTRGKINVLLSYAGAGWAGKTTQRRAALANGYLKFLRQYNKNGDLLSAGRVTVSTSNRSIM